MARLPSHLVASGLLRAAEAVGGNGAILNRGDRDSGALLLVVTCRGQDAVLLERVSKIDGFFTWNQTSGRSESADPNVVARLVDQKKRFDPDIWIVELDIPDVQQFVVDSLCQT